MIGHSIRRISSAVLLFAAALGLATLKAAAAAPQGHGVQSALVGTWSFVSPDQSGTGQNNMFFTYTADGAYRMVSVVTGGPNNGSEVQRWGRYQVQQMGSNQYQVRVQVTGGAPQQICAQGQGCTAVRGIQQQMNLQLQIDGSNMRQGDGSIFQRAELPPELARPIAATRWQGPVPQVPGGGGGAIGLDPGSRPGPATRIPGLGGNCDDLQQQRVCTINGGHMYRDNRGCQVCAGP